MAPQTGRKSCEILAAGGTTAHCLGCTRLSAEKFIQGVHSCNSEQQFHACMPLAAGRRVGWDRLRPRTLSTPTTHRSNQSSPSGPRPIARQRARAMRRSCLTPRDLKCSVFSACMPLAAGRWVGWDRLRSRTLSTPTAHRFKQSGSHRPSAGRQDTG